MIDTVVVLAAGKGSRMQTERPKVLTLLNGRPLVFYVLDLAQGLTDTPPVVVVGYRSEEVCAAITAYSSKPVTFVTQENSAGGTGNAVRAARDHLSGDWTAVVYGDMPFIQADSLRELCLVTQESEAVMGVLTVSIAPDSRFGRIIRTPEGTIEKIVEWKNARSEERAICEGNTGVYVFQTAWLRSVLGSIVANPVTGEEYLTDLVEIARQSDRPVAGCILPRAIEGFGINTVADLQRAERAVSEGAQT